MAVDTPDPFGPRKRVQSGVRGVCAEPDACADAAATAKTATASVECLVIVDDHDSTAQSQNAGDACSVRRAAWMADDRAARLAFAFRLFYGLSMPFWFEDERQVYLIGLRSFARGEWPYFGADVVWTGGQLPGALLGC